MTMGIFYMNALVVMVSIVSLPVYGTTISHHQHRDSVADDKIRPALMRRDVHSDAEKNESPLDMDISSEGEVSHGGEMALMMQEKLKSGHEHNTASKMKLHHKRDKAVRFRLRDRFMELSKLGLKVKNLEGSKEIDLCNDAYISGPENTNNCSESWHQRIDSYTVCETAMQVACPDATGGENYVCKGDPFAIDPDNRHKYPAGCFKRASDNKWFWNQPPGSDPENPVGIPVCVEYEFLNGTDSSMDTCPDGYSVIVDEYVCHTAAECQDYCKAEQFRILDPTMADNAPKGCHITPEGCLMFNNKTGDPTCTNNCNGKPMCNATIRDDAHAAGLAQQAH